MLGRRRSTIRAALAERDDRWRHRFWPARSLESFVVSFPKAGRTWLRVMLAVVEAHARTVAPEAVVQEWLTDEAPMLDGERILFTHALSAVPAERDEAMGLFLRYIGDKRRLFLFRDPRDVVVSYYFQLAKRERREVRIGSIAEVVRNPSYGIDRILLFMRACADSLRDDLGPALVLSYEDLHLDTEGCLISALDFFGVSDVPEDVAASAAEFATFENMHRLEAAGAFAERNKRLLAPDVGDPESFKTRRGEIGRYDAYLSADDIAYVEERVAALLPPELGYREPGVFSWQPAHGTTSEAPRAG